MAKSSDPSPERKLQVLLCGRRRASGEARFVIEQAEVCTVG